LPFAFADFFGNTGKHGPAVADLYRRNFNPSSLCPEPLVNVTVQVVCAPTEEDALFIASSRNLNRARRLLEAQTGSRLTGLVPPEEASLIDLGDAGRSYTEQFTSGYIDGDPTQVSKALFDVADRYETEDVGIVTIAYRLEDRIRSYQLVAKELGLRYH
jgi:alkanesulfonate monooxygenase SsuD/methylene tetrahydromethanopterin reductase-like flavin-dependent oxidoreductase (luciferase family)